MEIPKQTAFIPNTIIILIKKSFSLLILSILKIFHISNIENTMITGDKSIIVQHKYCILL